MKTEARFPSPPGERPAGCLAAVLLVGTLSMRRFGEVPFSVPSWPW